MADDPIAAQYQQRIERYAAQHARLQGKDWALGIARLITFLLILLFVLLAVVGSVSWWLTLLATILFVFVAIWHEQVIGVMEKAQALQRIHELQLARRARRWNELPVPDVVASEPHAAVARDLDLFGARSLFQWLSVAYTPMGKATLRDWLTLPTTSQVIAERQRVVRALAAEFDWREQLQLHGMQLGPAPIDSKHFIEWATGPTWLAHRQALVWFARAVPIVWVAIIACALTQLISLAVIGWLVGALVTANFLICIWYTGRIHDIFDTVTGRSDQVHHYREMLSVAARLPSGVGHLDVGGQDLRQVAADGVQRLQSLHRIVRLINTRRDTFLGILYILEQVVLLAHVHMLNWLEKWQRRFGHHTPAIFEVLGDLEAFASLATAAYDHPDWTFPAVDERADAFRAVGLGHPLLTNQSRVTNDVQVGPAGTFLLVTGSNMSGKSTLLRSIGLNALLARAGGVVCAQQLSLPPLELETSMRISDSLADGVSFFLAELKRLKQIVEHARQARQANRPLLYLLDEILQGTNSRERQLAVIRVIHHLLEQGAIGAVTTHDLELASCEPLRAKCQVVHFRESFIEEGQRRAMTFDYRLRSGLAPTTNALVLLEMVGLGEQDEGDQEIPLRPGR